MLRGNHPARIDEKGRLKVPNGFRALVESQYGPELFVTSVTGEHVKLYPMAVWLEIERKLAAETRRYQEIAQAIGKSSPDAARMVVSRALVRLAKEMQDGG